MATDIYSGRTIDFPLAAFSIDAIKRASYALMAQYDVVLAIEADYIRCTLTAARVDINLSSAEQAFRREVLDQDLRISIEARTEGYRDTILGLAFSRTGLQNG